MSETSPFDGSGTVAGIDFHMDSGDFEYTPEPSTILLLVPALSALLWRRIRSGG